MGEPINLVVYCYRLPKPSDVVTVGLYIRWHDYLGSDNSKDVTIRVGDSPAFDQRWWVTNEREDITSPGPIGSGGEFLRQIIDEDRLIVRTTPYRESTTTAVFDLHGIKYVVERIEEDCAWDL